MVLNLEVDERSWWEQQEPTCEGSLDDWVGGKALGSVSCPDPSKSWLFFALQWSRGCSWLSLWKKLLPNS